MKKALKLCICSLVLLCLTANNVLAATDQEGNSQPTPEEVQEVINEIEAEYLAEKEVDKIENLALEEKVELINIIDDYKATLNRPVFEKNSPIMRSSNNAAMKTRSGHTEADLTSFSGDIFATMDASTVIVGDVTWTHGHAGIGGFAYGSVIEARNPTAGVQLMSNRLNFWYGKANGGIYKVPAARNDKYLIATDYANDRVGQRYGFNALDSGDWYCSELVYYAWDAAGFDLDHNRVWGTFILPQHLMQDADTQLYRSFPY